MQTFFPNDFFIYFFMPFLHLRGENKAYFVNLFWQVSMPEEKKMKTSSKPSKIVRYPFLEKVENN